MSDRSLGGMVVLVTRPKQQADDLIDAINACGGTAIAFPVIEIVRRDTATVDADAAALPRPDISVFVSQNAVEHGRLYASGQLAAIGPTTAAALRAAGASVEICPASGFDSEHLLQEAAFNEVAGKNIRIIRGSAGREVLADTLRSRGARVDYLSAYEQKLPSYTDQELAAVADRWLCGDIGATVVMSVQSLRNLTALLPRAAAEMMRSTPLVTPAARVLKEAESTYSDCPVALAAGPKTGDLLDALKIVHKRSVADQPSPG